MTEPNWNARVQPPARGHVYVIGALWQPGITQAATSYPFDLNVYTEEQPFTREVMQRWVDTHAGDFSTVHDFCAVAEDGRVVEWADQESGDVWSDCMAPD